MLDRFLRWMTDLDHALDLAQLDDRMLADIGLERGGIGRAVRGEIATTATVEPPTDLDAPGASLEPLSARGLTLSAGVPERCARGEALASR